MDATAYIHGNVYTVNENKPRAEAFIVSSSGIFETVGTNNEIIAVANKKGLPIYDLKNEFIMPGIHDAHVHLLFAGYALLNEPDLGVESTLEELPSKLHDGCCGCAYTNVYGDWIVANGFTIPHFDRSALDKVYPNTPVLIRAAAIHACYANTIALTRAGINPDHEPDTNAAYYVRREDGTLTGELHETAIDRVALAVPYPKLGHTKRCLKHAIKMLHQAGVTSIQEAASNTVMLEAFRELDRENALKLNIATHIVHTPQFIGWESSESLHRLLDNAAEYKTEHIDTHFLKVIFDGVPLHPLYSHGELDAAGKVNTARLTHPDLASVIAKFDQRGVTCKVHCTGEGSTRTMLDAVEAARKINPSGPRHEVAHCSGVHIDDYPRFAELNCVAEMSPGYLFRHSITMNSDWMDWNFARMIENQAHMTIGCDWIGSPLPSLLEHCAAIFPDVEKATNGHGGEALCRMLTLNGAQAVTRDHEVGSIEVGKKANFICVSRDLSRGEFDGAKVLKTWFEGEMVWEDSGS